MSDLSSFSHQATQNPVTKSSGLASSWRQIFRRAMEQSTWIRHDESRVDTIEPKHMLRRFSSNQKFLILLACVAGCGVLTAFGVIRYLDLPVPAKNASAVSKGKSFLGLAPTTNKPKPAPGKTSLPSTETHPPNVLWNPPPPTQTQQQPSTAITPQSPAATATPMTTPASSRVMPALPAQPAVTGKPAFTPLTYQARHDKHFGGSCSGQLTLSAAGLNFRCADDPSSNIQVALNQIGAVDENGIETVSGKKYHFSIPGMSKNAEQSLFANWLHQVR